MRFAIEGARVVTMDPTLGEGPLGIIESGTVVVEDGRVAAVGRGVDVPPATPVVAAGGKALLPGLINLHQHAAMSLFRGWADDMKLMPWLQTKIWPAEARLSGEDVYWGTLLSIAEMLEAGTTCFADMYMFMDHIGEAVQEAGMRAVLAKGLIAVDGGGDARLEEAVREYHRWNGQAEGRISVWLAPHAPYTCPAEYIEQILAVADELDAPIHMHLHETALEVDQHKAAYGMSPIQHMAQLGLFEHRVLAAHCVHVDDADIAILRQMRGGVAHDPRSNLKLACGIAPLARFLAEEVPVGLGTDGAASANAVGLWEEMRLAAWLQKQVTDNAESVPASQALQLATRAGADILGRQDLGRIAPGAQADLVLVRLDAPRQQPVHDLASTLVYTTQDADVEKVWVAGQLVVDDGKCTRIDREKVRAEAAARGRRLVAGL